MSSKFLETKKDSCSHESLSHFSKLIINLNLKL